MARINYQKQLNRSRAGKTEPVSKAISPSAADQLGQALAVKRAVAPLELGKGYSPPVGPTSTLVNGPKGEGRNVSHCGSQGLHGTAAAGVAGPAKKPLGI
jgi:hypothetical protein